MTDFIQFIGRRAASLAAGAVLALAVPAMAQAYSIRGGTPGKWGDPTLGTGASLTWSVMGPGLGVDIGTTVDPVSLLPTGFAAAIGSAFAEWSAVADLAFSQVADPGLGWLEDGADAVDIRIGFRSYDGAGGNLGYGFYPLLSNQEAAGDILVDSDDLWNLGSGPGFNLKWLLVHEIGHALGLMHSNIGTTMYGYYGPSWDKPQADDIAGIQYLYGAPQAATVPLPAGLPLLLGALAALVGWRRRAQR